MTQIKTLRSIIDFPEKKNDYFRKIFFPLADLMSDVEFDILLVAFVLSETRSIQSLWRSNFGSFCF